jgi:hypothetical protein
MAPVVDLLLDSLGPDNRAAVGEAHVFFEIPAEVFEIAVAQERRERHGNADCVAGRVVQTHGERTIIRGGEQQP